MTEQAQLFDLAEGRSRRDRGARNVVMALGNDPWWQNALRAVRAQIGPFCSDEVRRYAGDPPRFNAMGALFLYAEQVGLIEHKGEWTQSERPEAHGRAVKLWHPVKRVSR